MFGRGLYAGLPKEERTPSNEFPIPIRRTLYRADGSHPDLDGAFTSGAAAAPEVTAPVDATGVPTRPQGRMDPHLGLK